MVCTHEVQSQSYPTTILLDNFQKNTNRWLVGDLPNKAGQAILRDNRYIITSTSKTTNSFVYLNIPEVQDSLPYEIEAHLRQTEGVDNFGFGVVFGYANARTYYTLSITGNGYAQCVKNDQAPGQTSSQALTEELLPWKQVSAIRPLRSVNVLTIRKYADIIAFYVNGKHIHSAIASQCRWRGQGIGFMVSNIMTIEVSKLVVRSGGRETINGITSSQGAPDIVKEPLGININSRYIDFAPVISADGMTLYFSRVNDPVNISPQEKQDIWFSTLKKDDDGEMVWGPAQHPKFPLNNEGYNAVISVTPDGNSLLLMNTYTPDGRAKSIGLSISRRTNDSWTIPKDITITNFYNRAKYNEYCLSPDGKTMLMSVERDDSMGEKDLYVSFLMSDVGDNQVWSEPKHMGAVINTAGNESTPFIAADGVTVYYSTSGKPGYGDADVFVTRRLDSTWTRWSEPQNLGQPINSDGFDAYYTVPARGDYAYLVSTHPMRGDLDIYRVLLPFSARPRPVVLVAGRVLDAETQQPVSAKIVYEDLSLRKEIGIARTSPLDGAFKISLPAGTQYGFFAEAAGYYPSSEQINTTDLKSYTEITRDLLLKPIGTSTAIRLNNIFFDSGKSDLKQESFPELDRLAVFLLSNPSIEIELRGHTDNVGSKAYNDGLSQTRVNAVRDYLVRKKNIQSTRLRAKGYGMTAPIADNATEEGQQQNRRVDFQIVRR